ncbi:MAG: CheR family methyltransferase [Pikeienuella sp.]|uniref:CheR family methyltransferase n=1 Tax=Pikeienuella sp. TaxID=2831957 RepID=UPI00391D93AE
MKSFVDPRVGIAVPPRITNAQAAEIVSRLRAAAGISIGADKHAFIELRVGRRLRDLGIPDFAAYMQRLSGPEGAAELASLVDCLATNTTSFFRETAHYDWLENAGAPELAAAGSGRERDFVIWSAACSLGAELWSAGMVLERLSAGPLGRLRSALHGTDVSTSVLERAKAAIFSEEELTGLPEPLRKRHLLRSKAPVGGRMLYRIEPELRRRAVFAYANLMKPETAPRIEADVAFLRNVLIYFEPEGQRRAIEGVAARLRPGGYLLLGHAEALPCPIQGLTQRGPAIYRKDG